MPRRFITPCGRGIIPARRFPRVRLAVSTTCALPQNVAHDFFKRFNLPLVQGLGVIELGLVALNTAAPREKWNSVGRVAGDFELRLVNPDADGAANWPCVVRASAMLMSPRGFRANEILRDGWFFTGDIGRLDAEGFLFCSRARQPSSIWLGAKFSRRRLKPC
jgi:long-chain acyl-CoA synthetase